MALLNTYNPAVPQGGQKVSDTQQSIENNFQDIYDLLAVNHVPFNIVNDFGKHSFVSYVNQSTDPSTSSTEMALYSKSVVNDPNLSELFYRYPSNGNIVQLTGVSSGGSSTSGLTSGGRFNLNATSDIGLGQATVGYWQYLSGGVLVMNCIVSNYVNVATSSPYTITFPPATYTGATIVGATTIPQFTQTPFNIQMTDYSPQYGTNANYAVIATSKTTADVYFSGTFNVNSTIASIAVTIIGI